MKINRINDLRGYMTAIENSLSELDLTISIETDFAVYRKYRSSQIDRPALQVLFDISQTYMTPNSAFWINCRNEQGKIVHSQAMRMYDMRDHTLSEHIDSARLMYVPPKIEGQDEFQIELPENTKQLAGLVSYHGEAWTHKSLRISEANLVFGRYGVAAAKLFWNIDHCFAFMSTSDVLRGLHARAGFMNMDSATWVKDKETLCRMWMVWMDHSNIREMVKIPLVELRTREKKVQVA